MSNIVLFGASGHAKVIIDIVEKQGQHRIVGLLDDCRSAGDLVLGYPILGNENELPRLMADGINGVIVAIGDNMARATLSLHLQNTYPSLQFENAIHPAASIARDVSIGQGSVVMAGCVVNSASSIGHGCILNTGATLDHDSTMSNFSSLAPGVSTGGGCHFSAFSAVGIGACIRHGITIGEHSVIGAGSVVIKDVPPFSVTYGNPARHIRDRQAGEKYL